MNALSSAKSIPCNIEAEKAVLSAILVSENNVAEGLITADAFYLKAHKTIFQAIIDLTHINKKIDLITLIDHLEKTGKLESVGGSSYLLELQEDLPSVSMVKEYTQILKAKALRREFFKAGSEICSLAVSQSEDRTEESIKSEIIQKIMDLSRRNTTKQWTEQSESFMQTIGNLMQTRDCTDAITGLRSGYSQIDMITKGFKKGKLIILAARPSVGKTTLAVNIATNVFKRSQRVLFFSLEMNNQDIQERIINAELNVSDYEIRNVLFGSEQVKIINSLQEILYKDGLTQVNLSLIDISEIRSIAASYKNEKDYDLIIVDYLGFVVSSLRKHDNKNQEVAYISKNLKAMAQELDVPVIACCQLSRANTLRADKRPVLSDLRDSGSLEQDADIVMFIHREILYDSSYEHPDEAEIIIAKNRGGPIDTVKLRYRGDIYKFVEW